MNISVNGDVYVTNYKVPPWMNDDGDLDDIPFADSDYDELSVYDEYLATLISHYARVIEDGADVVETLVAMLYEVLELGL